MKRLLLLGLLAACGGEAPPRPAAPAADPPADSAALLQTIRPAAQPALALRPFYDEDRVLDSVQLYRGPVRAQTIVASGDRDPAPSPGADLDTVDINLDGFTDLGLTMIRGATGNVTYDWWLFDPDSSRLVRSDVYSRAISAYTLDRAARRITTRNHGGHAGAIFEEMVYEPRGGTLWHHAYVRQDYDAALDRYIRATGARRDTAWTEVVDTLSQEELPVEEG